MEGKAVLRRPAASKVLKTVLKKPAAPTVLKKPASSMMLKRPAPSEPSASERAEAALRALQEEFPEPPYETIETGPWVPTGENNRANGQEQLWHFSGCRENLLADEVELPDAPPTAPSKRHKPVFTVKVGWFVRDEDRYYDDICSGRILSATFERWMPPEEFRRLRQFRLRKLDVYKEERVLP